MPCSICHSKGHFDGICSRSAKTREDMPIEVQNREGILGKVPSSSNVFGSSIVSIPGITKVPENAKSAQVTHGSSQHVVVSQQRPWLLPNTLLPSLFTWAVLPLQLSLSLYLPLPLRPLSLNSLSNPKNQLQTFLQLGWHLFPEIYVKYFE